MIYIYIYIYIYMICVYLCRRNGDEAVAPFPGFDDFADVQAFQVTLEPGDLLYLPKYWWHQVAQGAMTWAMMWATWGRLLLFLVATAVVFPWCFFWKQKRALCFFMILMDVDERKKNGERDQHDGRLLFARGLWLQMSVLSVLSVPLHV